MQAASKSVKSMFVPAARSINEYDLKVNFIQRRISIRNSESRNDPPFFCASWKERAILTQNPRKKRKIFARMTSQSALEVPKVPFLNCSGIFDPDFKYKHLIHQNDRLGELQVGIGFSSLKNSNEQPATEIFSCLIES